MLGILLNSLHRDRNFWTGLIAVAALALCFWAFRASITVSGQERNTDPGSTGSPSAAQMAIVTTAGSSNQAVIFSDVNAPSTQSLVTNFPTAAPTPRPHGLSFYAPNRAMVSDFANRRIFVIDPTVGQVLSTIDTTAVGYTGNGTIEVAPDKNTALAYANSTSLFVVHGPFESSATITTVQLPASTLGALTQSIVFDQNGRAFVATPVGVSVIDPPYTSVAFNILIPGNNIACSIGITPDGNTILVTSVNDFETVVGKVKIFNAPFSASSIPATLSVPGSSGIQGIKVAPNGATAIVASSDFPQASAIQAPFTSTSVVQNIPLPSDPGPNGFEDVGISADSQLAMLTGNGPNAGQLVVLIKAPFGSSSVTSNVPLNLPNSVRGAGAVRFAPASSVSVSGRITTPDGRGLRNAVVNLVDQSGVKRTATTSSFGLYSFDNITPGQAYTISITSRLYRFPTRTMTISADLTNVDFVGLE